VDLSGSAPQIPGGLNVPWASTRAAVVYALRAMTDPSMTTNDGMMRPVEILCPRGSVLNPNPPAAVSVRHNTCQRLAEVLVRAFSSMWPERAVASGTVTFFDVNLESVSPRTGRPSVMMDVVGGGTGGHRFGDGLDGVDTYMSNVGLLPVEVAEAEYAVRILRTELVPGSQGFGRHNGGLGLRREYLVLDRPQTATIYGEQTNPAFRPLGAHGGTDARETRITVFAPDGRRMRLPSKVTLTLQPGTVIRVETSGGGSYGDPRDRDPHLVREDALDGRIVRRTPKGRARTREGRG
jgi:N-methylhydantoinase B